MSSLGLEKAESQFAEIQLDVYPIVGKGLHFKMHE